jgi:hypothetical protein
MKNPIPEQSEPALKTDVVTAARRLRPTQAAPAQRDPRADGCIDERLGGFTPSDCACGPAGCAGACSAASYGTWWAI